MSRPLGFDLLLAFDLWRGELLGDVFSENVVDGDCGMFCVLDEFQPKNDPKPPAGDFGLTGCPRLSGLNVSSSSLNLRSEVCESEV